MRIQTETRKLPTELAPSELALESQKLAAAVEAMSQQKEKIAEAKGLWNEKKKAMEGYLAHLEDEANTLAAVVDTGIADRDVECSWLYALKEGYAFLVRDDTGELVQHRRLGDQERQENLLEALREPTPEQLKDWTEALGLVLDPQGDLPLAAPAGGPVFYYRDFIISNEHGDEKITGRFTEADHRPSSLVGVHSHGEPSRATGLPINRGELGYEEGAETLALYRRALNEILEAKREAARQHPTDGGREPGEDEPPAPTPIGRGRKAK